VKRKTLFLLAAVSALVVVAALLVWTKPWTLFFDQVVDEEQVSSQSASAPADAEANAEGEGSADLPPMVVATGSFVDQDHPASGQIEIVELPDGSITVTLVDLVSDNGPDVHVYLGSNVENIKDGAFLDLGLIKGNIGTQNYLIPAGVDVSAFSVVSLWCEDFAVPFGFAEIVPEPAMAR
jgi:hypothetical protein